MTKELEAFKRLRNNIRILEENTSLKYFFENDIFHFKEDLDIIENTLEHKEQLEKAKILEGYLEEESENKDEQFRKN